MGVSAEQFWKESQNGKAMVLMLARMSQVELTRDCLEWLISKYRKDLEVEALTKKANAKQAKLIAENGTKDLFAQAEGLHDRNVYPVAEAIIDHIFKKFFVAGQVHYQKALSWYAGELRKHVIDDKFQK